eukprot:13864-Heterococcus_DN1.PRE.1
MQHVAIHVHTKITSVHQLTTVYQHLLLLLLYALAGTGKTATFAISILQKIDVNLQECQALVLAPTRELAQQIVKVVRALGDYMNIQVHACVGGTAVRDDIRTLQVGIHTLTSITLSVGSSTVLTVASSKQWLRARTVVHAVHCACDRTAELLSARSAAAVALLSTTTAIAACSSCYSCMWCVLTQCHMTRWHSTYHC